MLDQIKSNTCPYCGARYTVNDGGCVARCALMTLHARLVADAASADVREDGEVRFTFPNGEPYNERA